MTVKITSAPPAPGKTGSQENVNVNVNINTRRFKIIRLLLNVLLMIAVAAALAGCSGRRADEESQSEHVEKIKEMREVREQKQKARESIPSLKPKAPAKSFIKRAYFTPQKVESGQALKIKVDTIFSEESEKETEKDYYFSYIFWKNSEKLVETPEDTLTPENYRKGDLIFADVLLYYNGDIIEKKRSEVVQIVNSSPVFKEIDIPPIEGPGIYTITMKVEDQDNDKIKYSLLPPPGSQDKNLPEGLAINPGAGTVTLTLGENPPPEKLEFIIAAEDGDGGSARKVVTITFKITRPKEQKEEEEGKGEMNEPTPESL
jgi:hypothetical protein